MNDKSVSGKLCIASNSVFYKTVALPLDKLLPSERSREFSGANARCYDFSVYLPREVFARMRVAVLPDTRRTLLGLSSITNLTADTKLDEGLTATATGSDFNKESALRDIKALSDAAKDFPELLKAEAAAIVAGLEKLEGDPALLSALQR